MTLTARPTTYRGIPMRSRLEARYAALLDDEGWDWEYEPRAYANVRGQYLPDFRINRPAEVPPMYVEVRPHLDGMLRALSQMPIIWDSEPNAYLLITAPNTTFEWFATGHGSRKWYVLPCEPWT